MPIRTPTWGLPAGDDKEGTYASAENDAKITTTWLGHACFLVELPGSAGERGVRILFDPVFSDRCSPSQYVGPKRYTRA